MLKSDSNARNLLVISGGSKGLGEAIVSLFDKNDWEIVEFSRTGKGRWHEFCDFSKISEAEEIITKKFETLSKKNWNNVVVVNNVGTILPVGLLGSGRVSQWSHSLNVNFQSAVLLSTAFAEQLQSKANNAILANVSSGAGITPYRGWSLYCAAKSALEMYTDCIALEQQSLTNQIVPIIIYPSVIDTPMQEAIRRQDVAAMPDVERFKSMKDNGVLEPPGKIANAVQRIIESELVPGGRYDVRAFF